MAKRTAKLILTEPDTVIDLPVYRGSVGNDVIDVRALVGEGVFTYDPGFISTAACESAITFIDGARGVLLHRGYPIDQLAAQSNYMELCYLLLFGELPTPEAYHQFEARIRNHTMVHGQIANFFQGFRRDAHPMAILCGVVGGLAAFYHDHMDNANSEDRLISAIRLVAKMPTIAAMSYKYALGQPFSQPRNDLDYAENFLHMMFSTPCETYEVNPVFAKALDRILMLHADHEQNASTSTVRLAGSTGANPFACISAGIAALWGPAHGGANEAVLDMLEKIGDDSEANIQRFIDRAKDKNDPFRLMGFGHRVYSSFDPRAKVMKETCDQVLAELGNPDDPTLRIAKRVERIALEDDYFVQRKLYPNVDFYSGIILRAMGIPTNMFTVVFAVARTIGWISHWNEMVDGDFKIGRPRQLYVGRQRRDYPDR